MSSAAAPVLLVGGWTLAQSRQSHAYNAVRDTISALAAQGAPDRWIMTSALLGLGVCHVVTAAGLRPARLLGRTVLAGGGVATILVASFPQPARGNSVAHTAAATVAFVALGVWPVLAASQESAVPPLWVAPAAGATTVLLALVAWFAVELHGGDRGLAERCAAGAQALWPLVVVLGARQSGARNGSRRSGRRYQPAERRTGLRSG